MAVSCNPCHILFPLKDVKYEGDMEMDACPPHCKHGHRKMDCDGSYVNAGFYTCF